jgi:hypothetical protein
MNSPRCEVCGDVALSTSAACARCWAWSEYGSAIELRGDPVAWAVGVRRFVRYRRPTQPDPLWIAVGRLRRQIAALENALGWQASRFDDLHAAERAE